MFCGVAFAFLFDIRALSITQLILMIYFADEIKLMNPKLKKGIYLFLFFQVMLYFIDFFNATTKLIALN
jgi:hypothetical protein